MAKNERNESDFIYIPLPLGEDEVMVEKIKSGDVTEEELREWLDTFPFTDEEKEAVLGDLNKNED